MDLAYTVATEKSFDEVERAVQDAVAAKGFRVLHVHDVQATFADKGIQREPYKIIEVCNVKFANQALTADPLVGLMMPCKINVYTENGKTKIALLKPSMISTFFPHAAIDAMGQEVEAILRAVVDVAK